MITSASHESVLSMLAEILAKKHLGKLRQRAPSHSDCGPPSPVIKGSCSPDWALLLSFLGVGAFLVFKVLKSTCYLHLIC